MRSLLRWSVIAIAALCPVAAQAAIWSWGCQGELPDQRVLFNRDGLYVVDGKAPPQAKRKKFDTETIGRAIEAVKKNDNFTEFGPDSGDVTEPPLTFSLTDPKGQKQKAVFTEKSSTRLSRKHRLICGRDEDTDIYRKVYRYERDGESARDITMQCFNYQLSTRGGRQGCE